MGSSCFNHRRGGKRSTPLQPGSRSEHRGAGCGGKTGNRDNSGKDKNGCRRERRRKWEALGVANGGEPRRWPGEIPREPVLRRTTRRSREQEGQVGHGEVCGMWSMLQMPVSPQLERIYHYFHKR